MQILTDRLGKAFKCARGSRSLRSVASDTGISAATLSRIENGKHVPDTATFTRICEWMGSPMYLFIEGEMDKVASVPDEVEALLADDDHLSPGQAEALANVFRTAYEAVRG